MSCKSGPETRKPKSAQASPLSSSSTSFLSSGIRHGTDGEKSLQFIDAVAIAIIGAVAALPFLTLFRSESGVLKQADTIKLHHFIILQWKLDIQSLIIK